MNNEQLHSSLSVGTENKPEQSVSCIVWYAEIPRSSEKILLSRFFLVTTVHFSISLSPKLSPYVYSNLTYLTDS